MHIIMAGWEALVNYLTFHRLLSLTIAFFLSGAIATFMSQGAVIKYFGPNAKKGLSYLVASVSGAILAVCSCSVLPMFASIRKKGAGLGPAVTFLFAGPAINVLAITFTFSLLGVDIGLVRVISAVILSMLIGVAMFLIYRKHETVDAKPDMFDVKEESARKTWQSLLFFLLLLGMLISGVRNPLPTLVFLGLLLVVLALYFTKDELWEWTKATYNLAKKIVPLFIIGIFIAGILTAIIPPEDMVRFVGSNTLGANLMASVFGAFMYFATLTEIPIVESFMSLGMIKGPATALLLAGPSLSLPNMIVIGRVMGLKRTATYVFIVVILSALIGLFAGLFIY
ncbi:MAG: permease [Acholeplasmataceae bacterium]|nr:MAG: permease [Acholeplasmataceae bacterium]